MKDKELRKLSRRDLLEMLIEMGRQNEHLLEENGVLKKQLEERKILVAQAGSIAEAAFMLNGVFEAAQKAADQYLENIQRLDEAQKTK